jgi:hypothetical protein
MGRTGTWRSCPREVMARPGLFDHPEARPWERQRRGQGRPLCSPPFERRGDARHSPQSTWTRTSITPGGPGRWHARPRSRHRGSPRGRLSLSPLTVARAAAAEETATPESGEYRRPCAHPHRRFRPYAVAQRVRQRVLRNPQLSRSLGPDRGEPIPFRGITSAQDVLLRLLCDHRQRVGVGAARDAVPAPSTLALPFPLLRERSKA